MVQCNDIFCGGDNYQLLMRLPQFSQQAEELKKSCVAAFAQDERLEDNTNSVHLHILPLRHKLALYDHMACFDSTDDLDTLLRWMVELEARPCIALSMIREPDRYSHLQIALSEAEFAIEFKSRLKIASVQDDIDSPTEETDENEEKSDLSLETPHALEVCSIVVIVCARMMMNANDRCLRSRCQVQQRVSPPPNQLRMDCVAIVILCAIQCVNVD